jgi:hypothetical protein
MAVENRDLSPLIAEIDCLRVEMEFPRWADLMPYCCGLVHPHQLDGDGLELLLERLCVRWADG